ncbi:MAG TPA: hypothetical protein VKA46_25495 [Gemmataceae bacterium]|nr:hypothetical protein [Gemmataceae bacterium]
MNPLMRDPWLDKNPGPFREGDRVRLRWGTTEVEGTVVEDRGNLGVGGKRLYGVTFLCDDVSPPMYTELEVERLTLVERNGEPGSKK